MLARYFERHFWAKYNLKLTFENLWYINQTNIQLSESSVLSTWQCIYKVAHVSCYHRTTPQLRRQLTDHCRVTCLRNSVYVNMFWSYVKLHFFRFPLDFPKFSKSSIFNCFPIDKNLQQLMNLSFIWTLQLLETATLANNE